MFRRTARFSATLTLIASTALLWAFSGCGDEVTVAETREGGPPSFPDNDAAVALPDANNLRAYCPSDKCPVGLTTCPDSHFPCDIDLKSDRSNCGACGLSCPAPTLRETYECIEGRCSLTCNLDNHTLNCDGFADNGCEIDSYNNNDHCGVCGNKCTDPDKPCLQRERHGNIGCGCLGDDVYCPESFPPCVDTTFDDYNCGGCNIRCDPKGEADGGSVLYPNTYYGCAAKKCGTIKCASGWADCDLQMNPNGCEISLYDRNNCGFCGNVCPADQNCLRNEYGVPECMCPGNLTYCRGKCVDLATDRNNCGSCNYGCSEGVPPYSVSACTFGTCSLRCMEGRADCNGNMDDDCETNTHSDPLNCGGCGIVCNAVAGQACVGGRCVVEPCPEDGGPVETAR